MINQRLKVSFLNGIILGVVCIIGTGIRIGSNVQALYLISLLYNRILMGIVIGLLPNKNGIKIIIRGAIIGFLISFAFYLTTEFRDIIGLIAGIAYGIIIDLVATRYKYLLKKWF